MPNTTRAAMHGFTVDGHVMGKQMRAHRIWRKGACGDAEVINIAPTSNGGNCRGGAGMRGVPQHNQRGTAPKLFHPHGRITIAGHTAKHRAVKRNGPRHVINQKHNVIYANKRKWWVCHRILPFQAHQTYG